MRTKDELFRAAQREIAARRQHAVMQAETARRAAYAADTTYGTKNEEGSGLGLQLVQDLTRRNGGELTIESTLGEGSTFTFTIAKVQPKSETVEDSEGGGIARP